MEERFGVWREKNLLPSTNCQLPSTRYPLPSANFQLIRCFAPHEESRCDKRQVVALACGKTLFFVEFLLILLLADCAEMESMI